MTYTLWHSGILIGETDFEGEADASAQRLRERRHLAGAFRPTTYGRQLLPRLCGILTAGADLKDELVRRGLNADDAPPDVIEDLFESTAAGAHIVDIGRVLSEIELRAPTGTTLAVASMAFIELAELASLSRRFGCDEPVDLEATSPDGVQFVVSVTLREVPRVLH
jgi:hypothetical protein